MKNTLENVPTDQPVLFLVRGTRRADGKYAHSIIECVGLDKLKEMARAVYSEYNLIPHAYINGK